MPALALAALTSLVAAPKAHAQVVFDNGAPDYADGYFSDPDYGVAGQFLADTFTFTQTTQFDTVQWFGVYSPANTASPVDAFTLSFYNTDGNGTPVATPFSTFAAGNAVNRTPTEGTIGSFSVYQYTVTFTAPVSLAAGTYGLGIVNDTTADTNDDWGWVTSNQTGTFFSRFNQSGNYNRETRGELAFNLQNNATVAPVPEPSTWAGMGMASFALCGLMIKARRKAGTRGKAAVSA